MRIFECTFGELDERLVERFVEAVVLTAHTAGRALVLDPTEDRAEIESLALPMGDGGVGVEPLRLSDRVVERPVSQLRQVLSHVLCDEPEEVDDVLGLAGEPRTQHRVLRRDADRAGVEVADTHHDAPGHDERCGREAVLLGTEQRGHDDIATRAQRAVALHGDAIAQTVQHQRLLGVGEADLPGCARMLERGER